MWAYRCYDDGTKPNLWKAWYDSNDDVHGSHDSVFSMLEQLTNWREPHAKFFDKTERIIEIRLSGDREWRVFGIYSPSASMEFIVLAVGYHKQKVYTPADIRKTLKSRKKEVHKDITKALSCDRPK